MTVHEALHFFGGQPKVARRLRCSSEIGLGYLRLGQPATTLSGGEAQRVKLAAHLARRPGQRVLYVLDEPTTGLHMGDVSELLACFERLLEAGATLLVIEHNMDVVKRADWVDRPGAGGRRAAEATSCSRERRRRWPHTVAPPAASCARPWPVPGAPPPRAAEDRGRAALRDSAIIGRGLAPFVSRPFR